MRKLLFSILLIAAVLLAAPTKHLLKHNVGGNVFNTTALSWNDGLSALEIQAPTGSNFYTQTFSASELKRRSSASEDWHGLLVFTAMVDTGVALGTDATDSAYADYGNNDNPDTLYFILEKNTGLHWAVIDTLNWYKETAPSIDLDDTLFTASVRGEYLFYMTDASRDTSETTRYLETFTHAIHRVRCYYGDSTFVYLQLFVEPY